MNTNDSMSRIMYHFEEPWFFLHVNDNKFPYPFYRQPILPYMRVLFHRVARHNLPHDSIGNIHPYVAPSKEENELRTGIVLPNGRILRTKTY